MARWSSGDQEVLELAAALRDAVRRESREGNKSRKVGKRSGNLFVLNGTDANIRHRAVAPDESQAWMGHRATDGDLHLVAEVLRWGGDNGMPLLGPDMCSEGSFDNCLLVGQLIGIGPFDVRAGTALASDEVSAAHGADSSGWHNGAMTVDPTSANTPAIDEARAAGIPFRVHEVEVEGVDFRSIDIGEFFAERTGIPGGRVFKTIVAKAQGQPVVALVPVQAKVDLKALAHAVGKKKATTLSGADAEDLTGYVIGGMSPLGLPEPLPVVIDESAWLHETIAISGGTRELKMELSPADLAELTGAARASITQSD